MSSAQTDVSASLQRILSLSPVSNDSFDYLDSDFDTIAAVNRLLPNVQSLERLDDVQKSLQRDQERVAAELAVLQKEMESEQDPERMHIIQELIAELMSQFNRIREKATESEAIVKDITKDIQVLDMAKRNIRDSMKSLKMLQTLANAISQLEALMKQRRYAEISGTLANVRDLSAYFKEYTAVERIGGIWRKVQELSGELRTTLDHDFDAFFLQDGSREVTSATISDACFVVDALGEDVRNHILDRYCSLELKEYRRIFRSTDEAGQLDNISRRFAWFRRMIKHHDEERAAVFPLEWKVGQHLSARFADITRDDLSATLNKAGPKLTVKLLIDSLQETQEFEASVARKYGTTFVDIMKSYPNRDPRPISSAFEAHMSVFVDAQDKALSDLLTNWRGGKAKDGIDKVVASGEAGSTAISVLPSSTELILFYRQSLDQCAKLSNKGALFDLSRVQGRWLKVYAEDVLLPALRRAAPERRAAETKASLTDLRKTCLLLNTAEYCQATSSQLEDTLKERISPEFREKISFQDERDVFMGTISSAITTLLKDLETAIEPHLIDLQRILWYKVVSVSSPSLYVKELIFAINSVIDPVRELIEKKRYFKNFIDKASSLIFIKFTNALVRSRPIKEAGAQQLLIDLQTLKQAVLKLPGDDEDGMTYTSFNKSVQSNITRLETLLKLVDAPVEPPDTFIHNYILLIGDSSFLNLQKILDLKGTPRVEQNHLIDTFRSVTSTSEDLNSTSFLSNVDMDPKVQSVVDLQAVSNALTSPPPETATLPSSGIATPTEKREVFSDLKRFVGFGLRRDTGTR